MTQTMPDRMTRPISTLADAPAHEVRTDRTDRIDVAAAAARQRAARSLLGLSALLDERPELRGVHAPADLAADAIRWSA